MIKIRMPAINATRGLRISTFRFIALHSLVCFDEGLPFYAQKGRGRSRRKRPCALQEAVAAKRPKAVSASGALDWRRSVAESSRCTKGGVDGRIREKDQDRQTAQREAQR